MQKQWAIEQILHCLFWFFLFFCFVSLSFLFLFVITYISWLASNVLWDTIYVGNLGIQNLMQWCFHDRNIDYSRLRRKTKVFAEKLVCFLSCPLILPLVVLSSILIVILELNLNRDSWKSSVWEFGLSVWILNEKLFFSPPERQKMVHCGAWEPAFCCKALEKSLCSRLRQIFIKGDLAAVDF